ncbi:hypothetical protein [Sphingomonas sp. TREG-RG-20F-R18-01]|uniref:hypothetical protein n=1 Tax=Sphingomonas sp. TREG-RG-20F-R18-01 TaxID=2914982 RepID=UPI001F5AB0FC|nr:hypothetical protein [Sphingomonas sp. TREG-RG-20F-R18-01]
MIDELLRRASAPAWMLCIVCLSPSIWRLARGRGRRLDPIWALVFLLAVNRLSFLFRVSAELSHATALILALTMSWCTVWYQRRDA